MNEQLSKQVQLRLVVYDKHTGRASVRSIAPRRRASTDGEAEDTTPDGHVLLLARD